MAYPAVNSLIQTLELLQRTYPSLIRGQAAEMIGTLRSSAEYFQNILENASHHKHEYEKIKDLIGEVRDAVQQAEDQVESNITQIMSRWSERTIQDEPGLILQDLQQAIVKIDAVRNRLALVIESSICTNDGNVYVNRAAGEHISKMGDSSSSKRTSTNHLQNVTVGLDDALKKITDRLLGSASEREVIPIVGMGGCGKTTLAKKALCDPSIKSRFNINAWVTISQEYHLREVMLSLVHSVTGSNSNQDMSDDHLMEEARRALLGQRYLIIIDDIWSREIWNLIARALPDNENGSRIILTTRLKKVAKYVNPDIHEMVPLNLNESWKLFCYNFIGAENEFPSQLEEIGKKIVGKCQGLPLAILVVAGHLSKVPTTKESWAIVAENVSEVIHSYPDECLAVLAMSYHHLPIHLKPCFLHFGIFPEDSDIRVRRLIRLWVAEGFLKWDRLKSPEEVAEDCLENLISRNLIMVRRRKSNGQIKTCGIHDLLRDLSVSEAQKEEFLVLTKPNQVPNFPTERSRFSLHTSISLEKFSTSSKVVRSLYFFEEPHEPGEETSEFKALRVLAAIPMPYNFFFRHHLTLHSSILRYLEVVSEHFLVDSLAYMYNLQTLIFYQPRVTGIHRQDLSLPNHIWNLKQLRYLRLAQGACLPNPQGILSTNTEDSINDFGLQHLQHLSLLRLTSCTKEVLSCLINLKKLRIDNLQNDYGGPKSLLNLIYLNKLESLFLWLHSYRRPYTSLGEWCSFPMSLKRLTIRGGKLPWKDMEIVAMLPNLQVLKLKEYAFGGSIWMLNEEVQFKQLNFLLLEHFDLKQWEASSVNFPNLRQLVLVDFLEPTLRSGLKRIPLAFADICTLASIELYRCELDLAKSAREIQQEVASMAGYLDVRISSDSYTLAKTLV